MKYNKEMVDQYYFGNPCFAGSGVGERLWTPEYEPNRAAFVDEVAATAVGKQFVAMFESADDVQNAWDTVLAIHENAAAFYGSDITVNNFVRCLKDALRTRKIVAPEPAEPIVEESEWATFYRSHTLEESRERARRDAGYAQFMQSIAADQMTESAFSDGTVVLNRPDTAAPATEEVRRFADSYNSSSADSTRPRGGVVTLSDGTKYSWQRFNELLSLATRSRLI